MFSAIVTAFTVESYQWLQEDPAQRSANLLAQISLQLSSFSLSPVSVNSTAPPLPPPSPFRPESTDIAINMMWFLSLTLSLLASFFTIAVQQWLRAYMLPRHLSVRESIRLREQRYEALLYCQVPNLISFLPILLQAAVVLFLFGVYFLLRELSHPITTAFAVISGVPFLLYFISLFLPLFWRACPYKSPLIPAIAVIMNWFMFIFTFIFLLIVHPIGGFVAWLQEHQHSAGFRQRTLERLVHSFEGYLARRVRTLIHMAGSTLLTTSADFWPQREVRNLMQDGANVDFAEVDKDSMELAPYYMSFAQLKCLQPCAAELSPEAAIKIVFAWMSIWLGDFGGASFVMEDLWSPIDLNVLYYRVNSDLTLHFRDYLLNALPQDWTAVDWWLDNDTPAALLVLTEMEEALPAQAETRNALTQKLFYAWKALTAEDILYRDRNWAHVPAMCLLQLVLHRDQHTWTERGV